MNGAQAAFLGVVQGFSEFLPISSSGHLVIFQKYLGVSEGVLVFDIFVHFATLLAVIIYFRKAILEIKRHDLLNIFVASIPAGLIGAFFEDAISQAFSSLILVGVTLCITGLLNFFTDYNLEHKVDKTKQLGLKQAIIIGIFQAIAILPGISRSGSTVAAGIMQGVDRNQAFKFSFLMVIPVIMGANVIHLLRFLNGQPLSVEPISLLIGGAFAFASGLLSLRVFEYVVARARMNWFGMYCIVVGGLLITTQLV